MDIQGTSTATATQTPAANATPSARKVAPPPPSSTAPASTAVSLSDAGKAAASNDDGGQTDRPSGAKAFAYGIVGLGVPKSDAEKKTEDAGEAQTENYYTAGRVLTSAAALGTMLSVVA